MPGRFQLISSLPIYYIFSFVFTNFWPINKHVFVLEIDIQIPRHIFIIWCMRRRFSAVLCTDVSLSLLRRGFNWLRSCSLIRHVKCSEMYLIVILNPNTAKGILNNFKKAISWLRYIFWFAFVRMKFWKSDISYLSFNKKVITIPTPE